jgi:transposase
MSKKELSVYDVIQKVKLEGIKQMNAAELLGISERHFRRLMKAYKEQGIEGIISKKRGKPSNNRMNEKLKRQIIERLKRKYKECGPKFASEKLIKIEQIKVSSETIRKIMIEEGLWEPKRRKRLKLHQRRNRRVHEGELMQIDGSTHAWFEERAPKCCLLGYIDDATSKIKHLKFEEKETTANYFRAMKEYMKKHGKPMGFYSDRFTVFRLNNDKEGYRKQGLTQLGRALKEIEVELICANSPQAKEPISIKFSPIP